MKLIENGLDSFKKGLESLFSLNEIDSNDIEMKLKDIVLSYHHGLETLFKYLITEKNEYLIYDSQDQYFKHLAKQSKKKYIAQTINFMDGFHRIIVLYGLDVEEGVYKAIEDLNQVRNSLTHHETDLDKNEVENLIASSLPFILDLFSEYVQNFKAFMVVNDLKTNVDSLYSKNFAWEVVTLINALGNYNSSALKNERLSQNAKAKKSRADKIRNEFSENGRFKECPLCKENFFWAEGTIVQDINNIDVFGHCKFCDYKITRDLLILNYTSYIDLEIGEEFLFTTFKHLLEDFDYRSWNNDIYDVPKAIKENKDAIKKYSQKYISDLITDYVDYVYSEAVSNGYIYDETANSVLVMMYDVILPYDRKIASEKNGYIWKKIDDINRFLDVEIKDIEINYELQDTTIQITWDDVKSINSEWLKIAQTRYAIFDELESDTGLEDYMNDILFDMSNGEIWSSIAGTSADSFGTIDIVEPDYGELLYIESAEESEDTIELICIFIMYASTCLYTDGEHIPNGSLDLFIQGYIDYNKEEKSFEYGDFEVV